ncbi:MAG: PKD domain-containing protein [Armatimonadota bacterium]|nr:PKD domain-containing protein [Armatimonadota bacterium]
MNSFGTCFSAATAFLADAPAGPPDPTREPIRRAVDLDIGEPATVTLFDGSSATVRLLSVEATRDTIRNAVREPRVRLEVNGEVAELVSANYRLPAIVGGVRVDCPITRDYYGTSHRNMWALRKAARVRLWPANSPLLAPGTFVYPARQRWFATLTQMANEPVYVNACEDPKNLAIYYHNGLDIGGCDGATPVVAAADGLVVSRGEQVLPGYEDTPVRPRYDVVYVLDDQGWYYRYSHLDAINTAVRPGRPIRQGDPVGILGKEGASGGWAHLHFDISARQPSGDWGTEEGYAYLWEAYVAAHQPAILAVARPHHLARPGESVFLDGSLSWSATGRIASYQWSFMDGTRAAGPRVERRYTKPGVYSEVLKVTGSDGAVDFDFATVNVIDPETPDRLPPSIHAAYHPTFDIQPGDPVTFYVRSFRTTQPGETWDFGDGTPPVAVTSDGNAQPQNKRGYATCVHRYAQPGIYLACVRHTNEHGYTAATHLCVRVGVR